MYNSIPNITDENNEFRYTTDKGKNWKTIKLDIGSYELSAINDEIQLQMKKSGDYNVADGSYYIDISANISKLKSVINITNADYAIDFVPNQNSVGSVLGWNGGVLSGGMVVFSVV
jgi:flagellar hook assembly protein FlgD